VGHAARSNLLTLSPSGNIFSCASRPPLTPPSCRRLPASMIPACLPACLPDLIVIVSSRLEWPALAHGIARQFARCYGHVRVDYSADFRGHKVASGAAPWLGRRRAPRCSLVVFPFLLRLVGALHPSIRVLVQIECEISLIYIYTRMR